MVYKDYFLMYVKSKLLYTRSTKKYEMKPHLETVKTDLMLIYDIPH